MIIIQQYSLSDTVQHCIREQYADVMQMHGRENVN